MQLPRAASLGHDVVLSPKVKEGTLVPASPAVGKANPDQLCESSCGAGQTCLNVFHLIVLSSQQRAGDTETSRLCDAFCALTPMCSPLAQSSITRAVPRSWQGTADAAISDGHQPALRSQGMGKGGSGILQISRLNFNEVFRQ